MGCKAEGEKEKRLALNALQDYCKPEGGTMPLIGRLHFVFDVKAEDFEPDVKARKELAEELLGWVLPPVKPTEGEQSLGDWAAKMETFKAGAIPNAVPQQDTKLMADQQPGPH